MSKLKRALSLFLCFFKIGLFTFGGGYAMIAIMEREFVERKKWLKDEEFADLIGIAESSPGPIAINSATYIGYKQCGILGSVFSTFGVVLPSFIIIFAISLFFDEFLQIKWVNYAFSGIRACVPFIILSAGIRMLKKLKKTAFNIVLFGVSTSALILLTVFAINFSSIYFILLGGAVGVIAYLIGECVSKNKSKKGDK